jgi:large subunit ribosomal protein L25
MAEIKITAEQRTEFGKGAARRVRRDNKVPAVLYGHNADPIHVALPGHELMLALKTPNALLSISLDGDAHLTIPKQVQRDAIKGFIEHADFLIVRRGEKVTVDVPINVVGEAASGTLVVTDATTVALEVEATHIPSEVEVSIDGLEAGSQILASDLALPSGAALGVDADTLIVNVTAAPSAADMEAEGAGDEAAAESTEQAAAESDEEAAGE